MDVSSLNSSIGQASKAAVPGIGAAGVGDANLHQAFLDFAGQTFYSQLVSSMRKTVDRPAYFHGGRAETVFQAQLDEKIVESMSQATAESILEPMYELFTLPRN